MISEKQMPKWVICTRDLLGEMPVKDGGRGSRRKQGASSVLNAGTIRMKGERGGGRMGWEEPKTAG